MDIDAAVRNPSCGGRVFRCAWLGPISGGLGRLYQRIDQSHFGGPPCQVLHLPALQIDLLQQLVCDGGLDRIILACGSRVDYPRAEIAELQQNFPDVPWAVAAESWLDGGRRTGVGVVDHLWLPWYRWWDGWLAWLAGSAPELLGPCQQSVAPWVQTSWLSAASPGHVLEADPVSAGIIVGNCRWTSAMWSLLAEACGYRVSSMSWTAFEQWLHRQQPERNVKWVLWDDTCLDTSGPGATSDRALQYFFEQVGRAVPRAWTIAAVSLPRADQWSWASQDDRCELIVKPDSGQGLAQLLKYIRATSVDPQ